jgi:hypothetical protein
MLTIGRFIPEKFGPWEKLPMLHTHWLREQMSFAWAGFEQQDVWLRTFPSLDIVEIV